MFEVVVVLGAPILVEVIAVVENSTAHPFAHACHHVVVVSFGVEMLVCFSESMVFVEKVDTVMVAVGWKAEAPKQVLACWQIPVHDCIRCIVVWCLVVVFGV